MLVKEFLSVTKLDEEHVLAKTKTDFGSVNVKRKFRQHTKEIKQLKANGIYCFEIQGVLYWYTFDDAGNGIQYKEPEDFRSASRTTNELKKNGGDRKVQVKKEGNALEIKIEKPEISESKPEVKKESNEIRHKEFETIKTCVENNIPVYLAGPAGSGKNFTLEQISWELGLEFYFTNSVQQEYKLTGFIDAGGVYHETEFYKAFKNGGIFFLDEMDASIPEVLVLLNAAIANGYFEFPNGKITAHKDFRVVAAGNTVGSGADDMYTGRLVLDQATLDRFAIIEFDYDKEIEMSISGNNKDLVEFIEDLRKQSKMGGIRATFSYRCITMVTKLEKLMPLDKVLRIAVFKGMDADTVNSYRFNQYISKYSQAAKKLQREMA